MPSSDLIKISVRIPKKLLKSALARHRKKTPSEIIRGFFEQDFEREKVMKAHLKLYGRFKAEDFDEGIL